MPLQLQVGNDFGNDGAILNQRGDNYGSTIVQEFNGPYAEIARRGQLFNFSVASAAAYLLTNTTGNFPTIWNPAGSGKILYILKLSSCWVTGATVAGSLLWNITKQTGSTISATAPIVSYTPVTPTPMMIGSSSASSMIWAPAAITFTAAPSFYAATGININATNSAGYISLADYGGAIALMPGNALSLTYSVTTSTATFWTSIVGAELPLPIGVI